MQEIQTIETMINEMNAEIDELKAKYQTRTQELFKKAFVAFFEQNPNVKAVGWKQYTPYFNDGDACVFRCEAGYGWATNAEDYDNIQYGEYEGEDESVWIDDADYCDFNQELIPADTSKNIDALRRILRSVSDDVYLTMFGDHVNVVATREGFDVQEYEHD